MTTLITSRWDAALNLESKEAIQAYLREAMVDGDTTLMAAALDDVLRSLGAYALNEMVGLSRFAIFQALNRNGHPKIASILQEIIEAEDLLKE